MPRVPVQIGHSANQAPSATVCIERLVNGYVERATSGKETAPVYGTPGLTPFATCGLGPIRGVLESANGELIYVLSGNELYSVDAAANVVLLGAGIPLGLASMAIDATNLVIEAGGYIWAWDGATLTQNTDPDALPASGVANTDAHFIFGAQDSQELFASEINDPLSYDALDFAAAEWRPDYIVTPFEQGGTLYALGKRSLQAFYYDGGPAFPYSAYKDLKIDVGVAGKCAATATNETIFLLAHEGTIRRLDGNSATPIQSEAVHRIIVGDEANGLAGWSDLSLTVASSHVWQGHLFIVFANPDGCVVFDQTTQLWHERQSYGMAGWRVAHSVTAFGKVLYGDIEDGRVYYLDANAYDEAGEILPFEMVTPFAWAGGKRGAVNELELICEPGVCAAGVEPVLTIERTKDGKTWSPAKSISTGAQGRYRQQVKAGRQGEGRMMAWRIRVTDAAKRAFSAIYADVEIER